MKRRDADERVKLEALREAAKVGLDDMAAGRYRSFDSKESLRDYLGGLAEEAIARQRK